VVDNLVDANLKSGTYEIVWNASSHPSGLYFVRLKAGKSRQTRKMLLVK